MLSGENVKADQSALTGESIPVGKEVGDEIFSGSVIKMGVRLLFVWKYDLIVTFSTGS